MTEFFSNLECVDKDITLAINSLHCPVSDFIWQVFSNREIWFILYAVVLFFLVRNLGWKRALVALVCIVLTIVFCDQFANFTKYYFQRLRPCQDQEMIARGLYILEDPGSLYGFYSAHAANALGFAVSSYLAFLVDKTRSYRTYGICIIVWGLLVGLSRVFVAKHFLGDVITGFFVAAVAGTLTGCLSIWINNRFFRPSEEVK